MAYENHWLPGFNFNVEESDAKGDTYETLAICRTLALARAGLRGRGQREARRPLHDPQPDARGEAAPGGRLVSGGIKQQESSRLAALTSLIERTHARSPRVLWSTHSAQYRSLNWPQPECVGD